MRKLLFLLPFLFVLFAPCASALQTPNITFIPSMISANASFIAITDPAAGNVPARVTWAVVQPPYASGLFPRVDDTFVCYFSNEDPRANCGPAPFTIATVGFTPYTMLIDAVDAAGAVSNLTKSVDVGGITITPALQVIDTSVYMVVSTKGGLPGTVYYSVYKDDLTPVVLNRELVFDIMTDRFKGNITLDEGEYYFAFWGQEAPPGNDFGGTLERVTVGLPQVPGAPVGVLDIEPVKLNILINAGQHFEQTGFSIINVGETTLDNLTVDIPQELEKYLGIVLGAAAMEPNDTAYFTVTLDNVLSGMSINTVVPVLSGTEQVGEISLDIKVSVLGAVPQECPVCPTGAPGEFTLSPSTWTGDFLVGAQSKDFTITNNAETELTGLGYTASGDLAGITGVELPASVPPGGSGTATVTITPLYSGTYLGAVTITSDSGSQTIMAGVNFYDDVSGQIEDARSELEDMLASMTAAQTMQFSDIIDGISGLLDDVQLDFDYGNYASAQKSLTEARAKIALLSEITGAGITPTVPPTPPAVTPEGGFDIVPVILIVVIIAAVGAAVWYYLTKIRKPKSIEEELEEEY